MQKYTLLIKCKDTKGLVYKTSSILLEYDLNIEQNSEFVDKSNGMFFMRTEISGDALSEKNAKNIESKIKNALNLEQDSTNAFTCHISNQSKKSIIILATKENHCLGDLLLRHSSGDLHAHILAVISNHNDLESLVKKFDIPYYYIESSGISRQTHESRILKICQDFAPHYIILAKYMRILSPEFVAHFKDKIINIHHSFLPAFIGANPYRQAFLRGVKIIGATSHFVDSNLDSGPIICQDTLQIDHTYTWQDMRQICRDIEKSVLGRALNLALHDRIFLNGNKTIVF